MGKWQKGGVVFWWWEIICPIVGVGLASMCKRFVIICNVYPYIFFFFFFFFFFLYFLFSFNAPCLGPTPTPFLSLSLFSFSPLLLLLFFFPPLFSFIIIIIIIFLFWVFNPLLWCVFLFLWIMGTFAFFQRITRNPILIVRSWDRPSFVLEWAKLISWASLEQIHTSVSLLGRNLLLWLNTFMSTRVIDSFSTCLDRERF